ncbi:hypothetical protein ACKS0A_03329 [Histoplasma ohiense]
MATVTNNLVLVFLLSGHSKSNRVLLPRRIAQVGAGCDLWPFSSWHCLVLACLNKNRRSCFAVFGHVCLAGR